LVLYI